MYVGTLAYVGLLYLPNGLLPTISIYVPSLRLCCEWGVSLGSNKFRKIQM